jgi:hypothetical protein
MRTFFYLTLCVLLLPASAPRAQVAQGSPTPPVFVFGTYNIQTQGDTGPITTSAGPGGKVVRQESETSSWQLTFYQSGTAHYVKTHVLAWTHILVYTQTFTSGPTAMEVSSTRTDYLRDRPDVTGSLTSQWINNGTVTFRQLAMSDSDPNVDVKTTTSDTKYDANNNVIYQLITPAPAKPGQPAAPFKADEMIMHLVLSWPAAVWSNSYSGTISVQNNYATYIAPVTGAHWLNVKAQWNLNP